MRLYIISTFDVPQTGYHGILHFGGARGVMVTDVGNEHSYTSSKSWTRLIAFHIALMLPWERYESNYSPSSRAD